MAEAKQQRTDLDIEHFRQRLMEEKTLAENTIGATERQEGPNHLNETGTDRSELADYDNHPADAGTEMFMREQDMALVGNTRNLLNQIERALEKIAEGTYGISDRSGKPIPKERLEAVPYATMAADE